MAIDVQAITFANRDGAKLFGTLHTPVDRAPNTPVIVLLSPGVKMRVGPHGLYNRMTERFNSLGFAVFKFDFVGLGDSEGELDRELLVEIYNDTETGAFVNDSIDALDWLEKTFGFRSFILGGLCGGAITALLTARADIRVDGILSLGMTTTLAMGARERVKHASQGELAALRKGYLNKVFDLKSWMRLLTLKSDFGTLFRSLKQGFAKKKVSAPATNLENSSPMSNANPLFAPAFFDVVRSNRPILLVFSGTDRLYWEFDEKFAQPYSSQLAEVTNRYELHVVKDANHVFSFREWEQEMLDVSESWLSKTFAPAPASA